MYNFEKDKKMNKNCLNYNSQEVFRGVQNVVDETLLLALEEYFAVSLRQIKILCKRIYSKYGVYSFYDGNAIVVDPMFLFFDNEKKGLIMAHEITHYFQWKELALPRTRSVVLDFIMELDANIHALEFYLSTLFHLKRFFKKEKNSFWRTLEKSTEVIFGQFRCPYRFSAFGVGGIFAIKQALDKEGANNGLYISYEGCHETLTTYALNLAQKKMGKKIVEQDCLDLVYGSTVNDMYFLFDFLRLKNNLTEDQKNKIDEYQDVLKQIKNLENDKSVNIVSFEKFQSEESLQNIDNYLLLLLSVILTGSAGDELIKSVKKQINEIIMSVFYANLHFLVEIKESVSDGVDKYITPKIAEGLGWVGSVPLGGVSANDLLKGALNFVVEKGEQLWEGDGLLRSFEKLIGVELETSYESAVDCLYNSLSPECLGDSTMLKSLFEGKKDDIGKFYCTMQFLMFSHTKDLQFLHSMDCSKGDRNRNKQKCIRFGTFCTSVYYNKHNELKQNLGDYVLNLNDDDILKEMLVPLLVPISTALRIEKKMEKKEITSVEQMVREYVNLFKGNDKGKAERSIFSKWTIGEFFSMKTSRNPRFVALGMACHMIEDSFTASHTIRTYNIFNEKPFSDDASCMKNLPPVIFYADYTKQDSGRHMRADVFVADTNSGTRGCCAHCDVFVDEYENEKCFENELNQNMSVDPSIQNYSSSSSCLKLTDTEISEFLNSAEMKVEHYIHSTVGAELAKKCAAKYLDMVFSEKGLNLIENFLTEVYAEAKAEILADKAGMSNDWLKKIEIARAAGDAGNAGRCYELEALETKEFFQDKKDKINDLLFSDLLLSSDKMSENIKKMGDKYSRLHQWCKSYEGYVEEYRMYLMDNFACSKQIPKENLSNIVKKDGLLKINNESLVTFILPRRLLWVYREIDLIYLGKIINLIHRIQEEMTCLMDEVSGDTNKEPYLRLKMYKESFAKSMQRYVGHLYEIMMNVFWIWDKRKDFEPKIDDKEIRYLINMIKTIWLENGILQISEAVYTGSIDDSGDAINKAREEERLYFVLRLLEETKHEHSEEEIAELANYNIDEVRRIKKERNDTMYSSPSNYQK